MTDSVRDTLIKARAKIADPKDWWGGGYCGYPSSRRSLCAMTAIASVSGIVCDEAIECLTFSISPRRTEIAAYRSMAANFNDTHTHSEVLALFDRAIGAA